MVVSEKDNAARAEPGRGTEHIPPDRMAGSWKVTYVDQQSIWRELALDIQGDSRRRKDLAGFPDLVTV